MHFNKPATAIVPRLARLASSLSDCLCTVGVPQHMGQKKIALRGRHIRRLEQHLVRNSTYGVLLTGFTGRELN
jgi:hypothetical protein